MDPLAEISDEREGGDFDVVTELVSVTLTEKVKLFDIVTSLVVVFVFRLRFATTKLQPTTANTTRTTRHRFDMIPLNCRDGARFGLSTNKACVVWLGYDIELNMSDVLVPGQRYCVE